MIPLPASDVSHLTTTELGTPLNCSSSKSQLPLRGVPNTGVCRHHLLLKKDPPQCTNHHQAWVATPVPTPASNKATHCTEHAAKCACPTLRPHPACTCLNIISECQIISSPQSFNELSLRLAKFMLSHVHSIQ